MIKLVNTNSQTFTSADVVTLNQVYNSNNNIIFNSTTNEIIFNKCGKYKIDVNAIVSATAQTSIQLYANGIPISDAIATDTFGADTTTRTLVINDAEKVIRTCGTSKVKFTLNVSGASTISNVRINIYD